MSKIKTTIIIGLILIAIAFYGGFKYGQTNSVSNQSNFSGRTMNGQSIGGFARRSLGEGGGMVRGDIVKKDDQSFTIALPTSGSQIIWYSTSTEVQKTVAGSPTDLVVGQKINVNGSTNSDGSLTANLIQLR